MAIIFPDIEKTLVTYFATALGSGVHVGTKHSQPDETLPDKQLVITAAYGGVTTDRVTKEANVTLDAFADSYADASTLGLLVEALVRDCVGTEIKRAEVRLGPVRTNEDSEQERRSIDVGLIVKGTDL
jgi:hypothetical protein